MKKITTIITIIILVLAVASIICGCNKGPDNMGTEEYIKQEPIDLEFEEIVSEWPLDLSEYRMIQGYDIDSEFTWWISFDSSELWELYKEGLNLPQIDVDFDKNYCIISIGRRFSEIKHYKRDENRVYTSPAHLGSLPIITYEEKHYGKVGFVYVTEKIKLCNFVYEAPAYIMRDGVKELWGIRDDINERISKSVIFEEFFGFGIAEDSEFAMQINRVNGEYNCIGRILIYEDELEQLIEDISVIPEGWIKSDECKHTVYEENDRSNFYTPKWNEFIHSSCCRYTTENKKDRIDVCLFITENSWKYGDHSKPEYPYCLYVMYM